MKTWISNNLREKSGEKFNHFSNRKLQYGNPRTDLIPLLSIMNFLNSTHVFPTVNSGFESNFGNLFCERWLYLLKLLVWITILLHIRHVVDAENYWWLYVSHICFAVVLMSWKFAKNLDFPKNYMHFGQAFGFCFFLLLLEVYRRK